MVCWLEKTETAAEIRAVRVSKEGKKDQDFLIATTTASRQSGFPKMVKIGDQVLFAWTRVLDEQTRVETSLLY